MDTNQKQTKIRESVEFYGYDGTVEQVRRSLEEFVQGITEANVTEKDVYVDFSDTDKWGYSGVVCTLSWDRVATPEETVEINLRKKEDEESTRRYYEAQLEKAKKYLEGFPK